MKVLVTGGAGFIGSNFVHYLLEREPDASVVSLDLLTYAGNLENLRGLERHPRHAFVRGDIADREAMHALFGRHGFSIVVNFAAESHVDRSILEAGVFVRTNVLGTQVLLEAARVHGVERFCQVSTDEVYGSLDPGEPPFNEERPLRPNSPYSASKAGADLLCRAYAQTYGLGTVVTRCSNNYGPCQFPEKFIPLFVTNALEGREVPLYGDGLNVRDWIHVRDHCAGVWAAVRRGRAGEIYHFGGNTERANLDVARKLLVLLGKPERLIRFVKDRPGHDRRYAVDFRKAREELGWAPQADFDKALAETVDWYRAHRPWWESVRSGAYREYYARQYGDRAP
ncbi:MAG: dTDP-glucose 4,6-dehydratase [Planctomycetota bacterium]